MRGLGLLNREEFELGLEDLAWRQAPGCHLEERPAPARLQRFVLRDSRTRVQVGCLEVPVG